MRGLKTAAAGFAFLAACCAQTQPPAFEVASVKPSPSMSQDMSLNRTPGGGLDAVNVSPRMLITFAYNIRDDQLTGGPAWLDTERYDIHAKAPADSPASTDFFDSAALDGVRLRTQSLLADRFKLVLHKEIKEMPVYALVVAKNGPKTKLEAWKEGDEPGPQTIGRATTLTCKKVSMKRFAEGALASHMGRAVLDKTGLSGDFNFTIVFVPERPGGASTDVTGPSFLDALEEQLGLKLESQRGPVEVLVIDHMEKASAN